MQCFMCYMLVWGSVAQAGGTPAQRSLFHDVLQSLLAPPPDLDNHLPSAHPAHPAPRLTDRLQALSAPHRLPKTIELIGTSERNEPTTVIEQKAIPKATQKPKRNNRPKTTTNTKIQNFAHHKLQNLFDEEPLANTMAGESHIGNAKSQTVIKPTIILNVKGTSSNMESRYADNPFKDDEIQDSLLKNEFNINQRITLDGYKENGEQRSPLKQTVIYDFKG